MTIAEVKANHEKVSAQFHPELATDFLGEDRHEFVAKIAYELWTQRGRPFGSPDVDWFAAEKAVYASLAASGTITPSPNDQQNMREKIYS